MKHQQLGTAIKISVPDDGTINFDNDIFARYIKIEIPLNETLPAVPIAING